MEVQLTHRCRKWGLQCWDFLTGASSYHAARGPKVVASALPKLACLHSHSCAWSLLRKGDLMCRIPSRGSQARSSRSTKDRSQTQATEPSRSEPLSGEISALPFFFSSAFVEEPVPHSPSSSALALPTESEETPSRAKQKPSKARKAWSDRNLVFRSPLQPAA